MLLLELVGSSTSPSLGLGLSGFGGVFCSSISSGACASFSSSFSIGSVFLEERRVVFELAARDEVSDPSVVSDSSKTGNKLSVQDF